MCESKRRTGMCWLANRLVCGERLTFSFALCPDSHRAFAKRHCDRMPFGSIAIVSRFGPPWTTDS